MWLDQNLNRKLTYPVLSLIKVWVYYILWGIKLDHIFLKQKVLRQLSINKEIKGLFKIPEALGLLKSWGKSKVKYISWNADYNNGNLLSAAKQIKETY